MHVVTHIENVFKMIRPLWTVLAAELEHLPDRGTTKGQHTVRQARGKDGSAPSLTSSHHSSHLPNRTAKVHRSSLRPCNIRSAVWLDMPSPLLRQCFQGVRE